MYKRFSCVFFTVTLLAGLMLLGGCSTMQKGSGTAAFHYDQAALSGKTPWTSKDFRNNLDNFQFVIIGDRTGGANVEGTFEIAMDQINLLQPEFVINVGDLIEGYTDDKAELNAMWEEAEGMTTKLQMPFFYTIGNHDVGSQTQKEVWLERHGADYYFFVYRDVLFMVLNSEDGSRPEPPPGMKESIDTYNRLQKEDPAKRLLADLQHP